MHRQRLIRRLSQGLEGRLTLVSGPAGFGKTTLLSAWAAELKHPVGWISLDKEDNDWSRFVSLLIRGLDRISGEGAHGALQFVFSSQPHDSGVITAYLVNYLADIQPPFLLILDDYHVITEPGIHDLMQQVLEHQPAQMHLVISTRSDPPWPLARWRARGELSEIRTHDLRFRLEETAEFLYRALGLVLSNKNLEQLETRIEGWVAGLQMAALSMQNQVDISGFIQSFTGSHRFVFDYLLDEVFRALSPDTQDFLLKTSILERLYAPLCDHLRNASDSQQILNQLDQMNLFVIPLDDQRSWYRYHHLFGDLIQQLSGQKLSAQMPALHRAAREWCQQNGLISEAIRHGFAEGNMDLVADLIENHFFAVLEHRSWVALTQWLDTLPGEIIQSRPWLLVAQAYMLLSIRSFGKIPQLLQQAEKANQEMDRPDSAHIRSYIAYIRAELSTKAGDIVSSIHYTLECLENLPQEDTRLRCSAASILGTSLQRQGVFDAAAEAFADGIEAGRTAGDSNAVISLYGDLIGLYVEEGKLYQAYDRCLEALRFIERNYQKRGRYPPSAAYIHFRLSTIFRHWNDLDGSLQHAQISTQILDGLGLKNRLNFINLAIALHAVGEHAEAHRVLGDAENIALEQSAYWLGNVKATRVMFWLSEGNLEVASQWALDQNFFSEKKLDYQNQLVLRMLAQVRLFQGKEGDQQAMKEALELLKGLEKLYKTSGATAYLLQTYILMALAYHANGKAEQAQKFLKRALGIGEAGGYIRVFVREGTPMTDLLQRAAQGEATPYIEKLLGQSKKTSQDSHMPHLVEPLTDREMDVLGCLVSGMAIPDAAESLVISVDTFRTHMKRIYRKLNVHSRYEAVIRARELKLL